MVVSVPITGPHEVRHARVDANEVPILRHDVERGCDENTVRSCDVAATFGDDGRRISLPAFEVVQLLCGRFGESMEIEGRLLRPIRNADSTANVDELESLN